MSIAAIDPKGEFKFIPKSELGKDNPITIYLRPAGMRESFAWNRLYTLKQDENNPSVELGSEEAWFDYITRRIIRIDNFELNGITKTITDKDELIKALELMPYSIGPELFKFTNDTRSLSKDEAGN